MSSKSGRACARRPRQERKLQQQAHRLAPENNLPRLHGGVHPARGLRARRGAMKAEVNEALRRVERIPRVVRLYVYNTFKPATETSVTLPPADDRAASARALHRARRDRRRARFLDPPRPRPFLPPRRPAGRRRPRSRGRAQVRRVRPTPRGSTRSRALPRPERTRLRGVVSLDGPLTTPARRPTPRRVRGETPRRSRLQGQDRPHCRSPTERYKLSLDSATPARHETRPRIVRAPWQYECTSSCTRKILRGATERAVTRGFSDAEGGGGGRVRRAGGTARRSAGARPPLSWITSWHAGRKSDDARLLRLLVDLPAVGRNTTRSWSGLGDRDVEGDARIAAGVAKIAERAARRACSGFRSRR